MARITFGRNPSEPILGYSFPDEPFKNVFTGEIIPDDNLEEPIFLSDQIYKIVILQTAKEIVVREMQDSNWVFRSHPNDTLTYPILNFRTFGPGLIPDLDYLLLGEVLKQEMTVYLTSEGPFVRASDRRYYSLIKDLSVPTLLDLNICKIPVDNSDDYYHLITEDGPIIVSIDRVGRLKEDYSNYSPIQSYELLRIPENLQANPGLTFRSPPNNQPGRYHLNKLISRGLSLENYPGRKTGRNRQLPISDRLCLSKDYPSDPEGLIYFSDIEVYYQEDFEAQKFIKLSTRETVKKLPKGNLFVMSFDDREYSETVLILHSNQAYIYSGSKSDIHLLESLPIDFPNPIVYPLKSQSNSLFLHLSQLISEGKSPPY